VVLAGLRLESAPRQGDGKPLSLRDGWPVKRGETRYDTARTLALA
jgi:hypothetical protein